MVKVKLPIGMVVYNGIKLSVKFEPEIFQQLKDRAAKENKLFSDIVNDVLKCGLLDLEDSERDEPLYQQESSLTL
jgi:hypothetical protein